MLIQVNQANALLKLLCLLSDFFVTDDYLGVVIFNFAPSTEKPEAGEIRLYSYPASKNGVEMPTRMAQCLPYKQKDPSSTPRIHIKKDK